MLDAIFSSCEGLTAADVNSSLPCPPARHCCTDRRCVRPLDLLDVPSGRRRVSEDFRLIEVDSVECVDEGVIDIVDVECVDGSEDRM